MKFIRTEGTAQLEADLSAKLDGYLLEGKKVLWLVPGGSNIPVASRIMSSLHNNLGNLTVTLTDERYGDIGHADSNQVQYTAAGFDLKGASFIPYLIGEPLEDTVRKAQVTF